MDWRDSVAFWQLCVQGRSIESGQNLQISVTPWVLIPGQFKSTAATTLARPRLTTIGMLQVVRMHGDSVLEWEPAQDRHIEVPPWPAAVHVRCEGAATALLLVAASPGQDQLGPDAERAAVLRQKHREVESFVLYSRL